MAPDDHRHDLYGPIHTALRLALSRLMLRLAAGELDQAATCAALLTDLRRQLAFRAAHIAHEGHAVRPALAACLPDAAATLERARRELRRALDEVSAALDDLEIAGHAERPALARRLVLEFSRFMAEDLAQMYVMEAVMQPALQGFYADQELSELEAGTWLDLAEALSESI
jgi:hypothetical protein